MPKFDRYTLFARLIPAIIAAAPAIALAWVLVSGHSLGVTHAIATMLRHRDPTFDAPTKERMHAILASKLGAAAPTGAQEEADPSAADSFSARAGTWLRENTRDQKTFDILFNENVTYGYRRNLFALKWPALVLNASIVIGCVGAYRYGLPQRYQADLTPVFVIAFLHALYLALFSSEAPCGKQRAPMLVNSC